MVPLKIRRVQALESGGGNGSGGLGGSGGSGGGRGNGDSDGEHEEAGGKSDSGIAALWNAYLALLDSHPVQTKALTSMLLNVLGDLFCQLVVEKRTELDVKRCGVTAIIGLILVGPTLHFWYSTLSKLVTAGGTTGASLRLGLDQLIFSPIFIAVFFSTLLTLEGRPQDIPLKLKEQWASAVFANWKIWIPFQFLNFRLVPLRLQVAASNVIALAWTVYLSFASHAESHEKSE